MTVPKDSGGSTTPAAEGRDKANLIRKLLQTQLEEVLNHLRVNDLRRENLTRADLRLISARLDLALDALTGTNRRDRALVWLDRAMRQLELQLRGRISVPRRLALTDADRFALIEEAGVDVTVGSTTAKGLLGVTVRLEDGSTEVDLLDPSFVAQTLVRIPWYTGAADTKLSDLLYEYLASLIRPAPPGRRRPGTARKTTKWERFHELAVRLKLWNPGQDVEELKRTLRRTRQSLRRIGPKLPPE